MLGNLSRSVGVWVLWETNRVNCPRSSRHAPSLLGPRSTVGRKKALNTRGICEGIAKRSGQFVSPWKLLIACLLVLPAQVQAQEEPGRLMLEAGIVGGNSIACPGRYVGINGRVAGPVSLYGMVETYRCVDLAGSANRIGLSVRLGRARWLIRPAVRAGLEYDGGDVSHNVGASLTFGRRYGARFFVGRGVLSSGASIVLLNMGGYISF